MARSEEDLLRELREQRRRLSDDLGELRSEVRAKVPVAAVGALGLGFVTLGGLRKTAKMLLGRGSRAS